MDYTNMAEMKKFKQVLPLAAEEDDKTENKGT